MTQTGRPHQPEEAGLYTGQNGTGSMCKWSNADNDCTRQGVQGNLAGTYQLRSHVWTTGSCG